MGNNETRDSELNLVAAVAELSELAHEIRFWPSRDLADRLEAIIAHRFGYDVVHIDGRKASA
ncbi:hypothetical protein [Nocardia nova]|uniref:hypothetical protein n=1 Tax=Nocardia nova TaxID=37330 RepID=UPI002739CD2A|nr:hypothetical protein [Nocardia nova]